MEQGKQQDWIHSIQQAREDFQNGFVWPPIIQQPQNLLLDWLSSEATDTLTTLPTIIQIAPAIPIVSGRSKKLKSLYYTGLPYLTQL